MKFIDLSWAAVCYFYKSAGDKKYCKIISDEQFISQIRENPKEIDKKDFEKKVILDYIRITNYDLLYKNNLSQNILGKLSEIKEILGLFKDCSITDCDFSDPHIIQKISSIYGYLLSIEGLWATGASKIMHILNDKLFAPMSPSIVDHFHAYAGHKEYISWLVFVQRNAFEVINDYNKEYKNGDPAEYLSAKINLRGQNCNKSLVKYIDEYYWLTINDKLPVPPVWTP